MTLEWNIGAQLATINEKYAVDLERAKMKDFALVLACKLLKQNKSEDKLF